IAVRPTIFPRTRRKCLPQTAVRGLKSGTTCAVTGSTRSDRCLCVCCDADRPVPDSPDRRSRRALPPSHDRWRSRCPAFSACLYLTRPSLVQSHILIQLRHPPGVFVVGGFEELFGAVGTDDGAAAEDLGRLAGF